MRLSDLLSYNNIVIQCHNDPDADALASGYALCQYLKSNGKSVDLIYGGPNPIKKSNMKNMVEELKIPVRYCHEDGNQLQCDLLVTVDCQYGQGNVERFEAPEIAVIDHHPVVAALPELSEVRSSLGSCSTLIWSMLKEEGFDINQDTRLSTALYYGLYMDTGGLSEVHHPMDFDLREEAAVDQQLMNHFLNSNMSVEELEVAGTALLRMDLMEEYRCALVKANRCDPNILGVISDLVLQVDAVDVCMVFCKQPQGVKYSVRSCARETKANELAAYIAGDIGTGGGHRSKAGGFLQMEKLVPKYREYCRDLGIKPRMTGSGELGEEPSSSGIKAFLEARLSGYFENNFVIDAKNYDYRDLSFEEYCEKRVAYGFMEATDVFPVGTMVTARTLYGDIPIVVQDHMVFLVGSNGDFSAISSVRFEQNYIAQEWKYRFPSSVYIPTVHRDKEKVPLSLAPYLKVCFPREEKVVKAVQLDRNVKLFTLWDDKDYKFGKRGDYLLLSEKGEDDFTILEQEIFESRYRKRKDRKSNENEKKAVIFDMDGTVLDTLADLTNATNYALRKNNMPERTFREVKVFVGNGIHKLIERAVPKGAENPLFDAVFHDFLSYYKEHAMDNTVAFPGILELMTELKERGIKMAIVSNKIDSGVKALAEAYFLDYLTDAVGESDKVGKKPAPDMVFKALESLEVSVEDAIYVGDSEVDIETAKNAGMECVSVLWGLKDRAFLEEHGAENIVSTPLEILRYV